MLSVTSVHLLSCVWLSATPWASACQASLSITNSRSPPKPMSIESVMPSNHLILCHPVLLLPSIFPSIRIFSNESALRIRWSKYWNFSFNVFCYTLLHFSFYFFTLLSYLQLSSNFVFLCSLSSNLLISNPFYFNNYIIFLFLKVSFSSCYSVIKSCLTLQPDGL